jgi:hypothetical protein
MSRIMDNRLRAILTGSRSHPMASNSPHIPNKRTSSWEEILRPAIGSRHNTKEQVEDAYAPALLVAAATTKNIVTNTPDDP